MINTHCTYVIGTDAYPCTIIETSKTGHWIKVQYDNYRASKIQHDYYGQQNWVIERNFKGRTEYFTKRKGDIYRPKGASSSGRLIMNRWNAKQDPHF